VQAWPAILSKEDARLLEVGGRYELVFRAALEKRKRSVRILLEVVSIQQLHSAWHRTIRDTG
jgi:hypothetical protein